MTADNRLASYGTLAPGRVNHHHLAELRGRWMTGTVRSRLVDEGWAAAMGFPALILDSSAPEIEIHLFESDDLPNRWPRLDAFEGAGYLRVKAQIDTSDGPLEAWIYVDAGVTG